MKKASFLVTDGIPGIASKGEIIKVSDNAILVGRWLPISKYPELMENGDSLLPTSEAEYSPEARPRRHSPEAGSPRRQGGTMTSFRKSF